MSGARRVGAGEWRRVRAPSFEKAASSAVRWMRPNLRADEFRCGLEVFSEMHF